MAVKLQLKHSSTKGKVPQASDLVNGELALNINSESPAAYIKDSAGNVIQLAGLTGSETAPASPTTGQVWVNSSVTPNVINVYNGTSWIPQTGSTVSGTTAPATPAAGQIWVDTNTSPNVVKIWDGVAWVVATPTGSDAQAIANDAKYATKDQLNAEDLWDKAGTDISPKVAGDGVVLKDGTGTASVDLDAGTSAAPLVRDASGRLLVGTSTASGYSGSRLIVRGAGTDLTGSGNFVLQVGKENTAVTAGAQIGTVQFGDTSGFGYANIVAWADGDASGDSPGRLSFATTPTGSAAPEARMTIKSDGNVGIGTATPNSILTTNGSFITVQNAGTNVGLIGPASNVISGGVGTDFGLSTSGGALVFGSGGTTERARIDSSGKLLVGASASITGVNSQFGKLQNIGNTFAAPGNAIMALGRSEGAASITAGAGLGTLYFTDNAAGEFASISSQADADAGAGSYPGRLLFSTTPTGSATPVERMRIGNTGDVGMERGLTVGSTVPLVSNRFCLSAAVAFSGAGNSTLKYNTTTGEVTYDVSSRLVKEQVVDCPYGIEAVKALKPRKYFRTDDQREEVGFIADELASVLPELVPLAPKAVITKEEKDTEEIPVGVYYDKLTAVLTAALQEAIGRIEQLEAKVTALEGGAPAKSSDPGTKTRR